MTDEPIFGQWFHFSGGYLNAVACLAKLDLLAVLPSLTVTRLVPNVR